MSALEPTPEQIQALTARPADEPVVMVNLLKFREGGQKSYIRYPFPAAFMETVSAEGYPHAHRTDALDRGDLIATSIWAMDG